TAGRGSSDKTSAVAAAFGPGARPGTFFQDFGKENPSQWKENPSRRKENPRNSGRKIQEVCFHESIFFNGLRRPLAILRFWPENFAAPFLAFAAKTCFLQIPVIKAPLTPVAGFSRKMGSI